MSTLRTELLDGLVPSMCNECHAMEEHKKISGRQRQLLKVGVQEQYFSKSLASSPLKSDFDYKNLTIVQSEYHGRGELLPYIYYLRNKWFENAVIIHDSVFFHFTYNFENVNRKFASLWYFGNNDSELYNILRVASNLNNNEIIKKYILEWKQNKWLSSQGAQTYINHNFLVYINKKYNIENLISVVLNRNDRATLERIMGILIYIETKQTDTVFGDINNLYKAGRYTFDEYMDSFSKKTIPRKIVKVWTGR
jgi:hypothetical protein